MKRFAVPGILLLTGCTVEAANPVAHTGQTGFVPDIAPSQDLSTSEQMAVTKWIDTTLTIMQSPEFEDNLARMAETHPQVWISKTRDTMPTARLRNVLNGEDIHTPTLWWPKTHITLTGRPSTRMTHRRGFGFTGKRNAGAEALPHNSEEMGRIEISRFHLARFQQGDFVETSCAVNTLAHEISHTLSNRPDRFWMHILDTGDDDNAPHGMYEASYLIGAVAQCTYLQSVDRIGDGDLRSCMQTFSDPRTGSRFRSRACDDFPGSTPISPQGRLSP